MKEIFNKIKGREWDWFGWGVKIYEVRESSEYYINWETDDGSKFSRSLADLLTNKSWCMAVWGEADKWWETECTCGGVDFHISGAFDAHKKECKRVKSDRGSEHCSAMAFQILQNEGHDAAIKYIKQTML